MIQDIWNGNTLEHPSSLMIMKIKSNGLIQNTEKDKLIRKNKTKMLMILTPEPTN